MKIYDYNGKKNVCGERIHEARCRLRLTQSDLAAQLQVNGICIKWVTMDEAVRLIENQDTTMDSRKFVRARDLAALEAYRRKYDK